MYHFIYIITHIYNTYIAPYIYTHVILYIFVVYMCYIYKIHIFISLTKIVLVSYTVLDFIV